MPKLYFRYGTVGSAKTLNLLAVAHNYEQQNKKIIVFKPVIDTRFGVNTVKSRAGLSREAIVIMNKNDVLSQDYTDISCVLVDEAQFLSSDTIDTLRQITLLVPVICYGLRTDFMATLFEGSRRLFEIADTIEEIKTTCTKCNKKAILNIRHQDGKKIIDGPQIELGTEDVYASVCYFHF